MSNELIEAHPAVAGLARAIVQDQDGLRFAEGAAEEMRAALRGAQAETVSLHLAALAVKSHRIAGPVQARPLLEVILSLLSDYAGREQALSQLQDAGLSRDAAAAVGASIVTRAPEAPRAAPPPTAKPKRGLTR